MINNEKGALSYSISEYTVKLQYQYNFNTGIDE